MSDCQSGLPVRLFPAKRPFDIIPPARSPIVHNNGSCTHAVSTQLFVCLRLLKHTYLYAVSVVMRVQMYIIYYYFLSTGCH